MIKNFNLGQSLVDFIYPDEKRHDKRSFMIVLERISAVAAGAFAVYVKWKLFAPYFIVGVVLGVGGYFKYGNLKQECHSISGCASDTLEGMTGVKLPPIVGLVSAMAVWISHIDHHQKIFVPITAVTIGYWLGRAAPTLNYRKIIFCC